MKVLKNKRLLVLGGSIWKDAIKQFAEDYDVTIIAAGLYHAGIFDIADEYYYIDTINSEIMKEFIKEKKIDGVYMGGSELIISNACKYINELGLPCYCTIDQWNYLQNKEKFKELCIVHDIPVVPKYTLESTNINYPVITKPVDGCGSSGFSVCNNKEELIKGYNLAKDNSTSGNVIIEKFVKNDGVVVFYTFSNGKLHFSGLEDKYPVRYEKEGSYVGGLFVFESSLTNKFRTMYETKIEKMFNSIGIKEGTIWIEIFNDNGNFYFNEVGFRYGGSASIYPINYLYKINQVYSDIYYALTGESCIEWDKSIIKDNIQKCRRYAVYPIHMNAGTIESFKGHETLLTDNRIVAMPIIKSVGQEIKQTGSFSQAVALVHFVFNTDSECNDIINHIHNTFKVIDSNGDNLVHKMLNTENLILR